MITITEEEFLMFISGMGIAEWNKFFLSMPGFDPPAFRTLEASLEAEKWIIDLNLGYLSVQNTDFDHIILTGAGLYNASFRHVSFRNSNLRQIHCTNSFFHNCDFSYSDFTYANLSESRFVNCIFKSTKLYAVDIKKTKFENCDFDNTEIVTMDDWSKQKFGISISELSKDIVEEVK